MSEQNPPETSPEASSQPEAPLPTAPPPERKPQPAAWKKPDFPWVTYALVALTVLVYIVQQVLRRIYGLDLLFVFFGKINAGILAGEFWRLLTPALLHSSLIHLMFNMYALSMLGRQMKPFYGRGRFFMLYVLSAFGGNVLSFALSRFNSLGASTAIFGLLAAEGVFIWQNRGVFGKQSQGILMNLAFVLVLNLFIGISPGSNTDNWGHLGGLLAGFFFAFMAGPLLVFRRVEAGARLADSRTKRQVWLGALMVLAAFGAIAAIPFFAR